MNLNDLIENMGVDKQAPPIPSKGARIRYFTAIVRWPIRILILPFIWLDSLCQKIAKLIIPTPYVRAGKCRKRGNCCHYILVRKVRGFFGFIDLFWHTQINGFFLRSKNPIQHHKGQVYVMGCRYLKKSGACSRYIFRPAVCRDWPKVEIFGQPEILKGCGIYAKERKSHPLNILKD